MGQNANESRHSGERLAMGLLMQPFFFWFVGIRTIKMQRSGGALLAAVSAATPVFRPKREMQTNPDTPAREIPLVGFCRQYRSKKRDRLLPRRRTSGKPDGRTAGLRRDTSLLRKGITNQKESQGAFFVSRAAENGAGQWLQTDG